jgi:GNAT superfamily N-acetyltransferase
MTQPLELMEIFDDPALMKQIAELRVEAWRTFISIESGTQAWANPFDPIARHRVLLDTTVVVAAARLSIHKHIEEVPEAEVYRGIFPSPLPHPIASINRLVIHPRYRGRNLTTRLDEARIEAAERYGCRCIVGWTNSGDKRVAQLTSHGFQLIGKGKRIENGIVKGLVPAILYLPLPRRAAVVKGVV